MKVEVFTDSDALSQRAAELVTASAEQAIQARGIFTIAFSGGRSPWGMLGVLARQNLPWQQIHVLQVDERIAPAGSPQRNLTGLEESFLSQAPLLPTHMHAMPVEMADSAAAAAEYARTLEQLAGSPPVLDLIHLGLGDDGHTASLVPGDPVLKVLDAEVAVSQEYQGTRRLTLTYPVLNRARQIVYLVTGASKADALLQLVQQDPAIPAGSVSQEQAIVLADAPAASKLSGRP